jgi:ketosteroid isomerase-like protein
MAHPNEDLLRRGYDAFGAGDMETVLSIFADDISWHVGGNGPLSGDYQGHQEVMGFFGRLMELTGGTFHLEVHDILANDGHGAAMVIEHAEREGHTLDSRSVHTWHLAGGKATEFWSFEEDQAALDRFLA